MTLYHRLQAFLAFGSLAAASLSQTQLDRDHDDDDNDTPLPVVIWHGLGDKYNNEGLLSVSALLDAVNPGTFVHVVQQGSSPDQDQQATFLGDVNAQVDKVCVDLAAHPILSTAPAIDAIGFSQGGQFLRAYVERCNFPPVRNLISFGAQHSGIAKFGVCGDEQWVCKAAMALLRWGVWSDLVQSRVVPAQYYRGACDEFDQYLTHSAFLADVNNERESKDSEYKKRLTALENLVMFMFEEDTTVVPRESSWFGEVCDDEVIPLKDRAIYKQDWLGLRELDNKGSLHFRKAPGQHMQLSEELLNQTFHEFFGPWKKTEKGASAEQSVLGDL